MKKTYFITINLLVFSFFLNAQININHSSKPVQNINHLYKSDNSKTINCIDSVRYPQSKLSGTPETGALTNNTATQTGISQAFHYTGNGLVHGIGAYLLLDFDGVPGNFPAVAAKIKVYNIDIQNYPTTVIDSAVIQVSDVGFNEQTLMFSNPIAVSDSFAIAIEMDANNATTDTIWYTTNICAWNGTICTVGDGNNENLSCVLSPDFVSANGSHWFNNNIEVFGWNIDFLMHPIIQHDITASYTTDVDSILPGGSVVFTNTSTHITDVMFNRYNSTTNPLYTWDFNDGTGVYHPFDTTYMFAAQGTYNTQLTANYYGYTLNCMDTDSKPIYVSFPASIEEEVVINTPSIYPIPANKFFYVNVPNKYYGGEIVITDVVGKTSYKTPILTEQKTKVTTSNLSAGIYFVSIDFNGERVFSQRIVVDK